VQINTLSQKIGIVSAVLFSCVAFSPITQAHSAQGKHAVSAEDKPAVYEEQIKGKSFVVTRVLVKAKPDQVWPILADYNNAPHIFSILKKCQMLEDKGTKKIVKHQLAPSGLPATYEYIVEIQECAPRTMEWHRVSGDFREVDGFWKLEPAESGRCTMVTYASHVTGGFFTPQALIKRQLRTDMPTALTALKNQAEGPMQIASHHLQNDRLQ